MGDPPTVTWTVGLAEAFVPTAVMDSDWAIATSDTPLTTRPAVTGITGNADARARSQTMFALPDGAQFGERGQCRIF